MDDVKRSLAHLVISIGAEDLRQDLRMHRSGDKNVILQRIRNYAAVLVGQSSRAKIPPPPQLTILICELMDDSAALAPLTRRYDLSALPHEASDGPSNEELNSLGLPMPRQLAAAIVEQVGMGIGFPRSEPLDPEPDSASSIEELDCRELKEALGRAESNFESDLLGINQVGILNWNSAVEVEAQFPADPAGKSPSTAAINEISKRSGATRDSIRRWRTHHLYCNAVQVRRRKLAETPPD